MKLSPRIFTNVLQPIRMSVPRSYFSIQHLRKLNPEYKIATHLFEMNLRMHLIRLYYNSLQGIYISS